MNSIPNADKNVKKFIEKHGNEGFLKLLYSNYLFDLVTYFLQTKESKKEENPGYLFFFDLKDKPISPEKLDDFNEKLKKICENQAEKILDSLETTNSVALSLEPFNKNSQTLLEDAFSRIIKKLDD